MTDQPAASRRLARALRRRCPRCNAPAFDSYFTLKETCDGCGHRFERESGYWVGALIINTAFIFGTFLLVFVGGIAMTWPDVPWTALLIVLVILNITIPIAFYPQSKTLWVALEIGWNPIEGDEAAEAARRITRGA